MTYSDIFSTTFVLKHSLTPQFLFQRAKDLRDLVSEDGNCAEGGSGWGPIVDCCDDGAQFSGSVTTNVTQHYSRLLIFL
jgi:hypothetical protein